MFNMIASFLAKAKKYLSKTHLLRSMMLEGFCVGKVGLGSSNT